MQSFICFVKVFAMSLAIDVSVYSSSGFYAGDLTDGTKTVPKTVSCFSFGYHPNDLLYMRLYIRNEPPGVTAIHLIYQSGLETLERSKTTVKETGEEYYWVRINELHNPEVKISLKLLKSNGLFSSVTVAEGRDVMALHNKMTKEIYTYNDICSKTLPCVLMVNLKYEYKGLPNFTRINETTTPLTTLENHKNNVMSNVSPSPHENTKTSTSSSTSKTGTPVITKSKISTSTEKPVTDSETLSNSSFKSNVPTSPHHENIEQKTNDTKSPDQQPPPPNVFIYVFISIVVMSVIILVICLFTKKYCHQNSQPVETIELNTYATANEVVYAELSLMHGESQPPRHEEESPYAKIIGVLKPADGKRKINNKS